MTAAPTDGELARNRCTPEGRKIGEQLSRMTDVEVGKLIVDGEWDKDERCASCAFRFGTVPNGCPQTQMDTLKAVLEHECFNCHVARDGMPAGAHPCMGWFAAVQAVKGKPKVKCPWEFSPPDPKPAHGITLAGLPDVNLPRFQKDSLRDVGEGNDPI